ncbi:MAG: spore cortex biosynthesis protein YabQ [Clostridia bacterium]|nr:spore cortex biosynthesis protein YabQ [Clostridia bacterium]
MKELTLKEQEIILMLSVGAFFGVLLIILKIIREKYRFKKILIFIADFTFTAFIVVVTYIVSIALTFGRIRLVQVLFEAVSMLITYYSLEPCISAFLSLSCKFKALLRKIDK